MGFSSFAVNLRGFLAQHRHLKMAMLIFISISLFGFTTILHVNGSKQSQLTKLASVYSRYLEEKIRHSFDQKFQRLHDYQSMWSRYNMQNEDSWLTFAGNSLESDDTIRTQGVINSRYEVILRYPENAAYRKELTRGFRQSVKDLLEVHKKINTIYISDYEKMRNGNEGYVFYIPLYKKDQNKNLQPDGFYYMVIEGYKFLNQIIRHDNFSVQLIDHGKVILNLTQGSEDESYVHINSFEMYQKRLELRVYPTQALIGSLNMLKTWHMALAVFVISSLISFLYYFLRVAVDRQQIISFQTTQIANSKRMMALAEMASGVAHEINNPLSILNGKVDLIRRAVESESIDKPKIHSHLERMEQLVFRIAKIITSLKKLGYKTEGDSYESVHLQSIVDDVLDLYNEKLKSQNIELFVEKVPDKYVDCRPSEISQILSNLLSNSYDAVLNFKTKWIRIGFSDLDSHQGIEVTDSGAGIPQHIQYKILEPFFTTKPVGQGMGIGLSISHSLAQQNKGELYLDKASENTKFVLKVPTTMENQNLDF